MTPDPTGLLEASEMVRRELASECEDFGDRGGLRVVHSSQGEQDAKTDVAVLPMTRVEPIHFGFAAGHVVPTSAVGLLLVEESVLDERVQMVPRGADGQAKRPRDGSEVVPREEAQMVVDLSTDRMLEPTKRPRPIRSELPPYGKSRALVRDAVQTSMLIAPTVPANA